MGRSQRNFLAPVPVVDSLVELNEKLRVCDEGEDRRRISHRLRTIRQDFALEAPLLGSLPAESFEPGLVLAPRVDRSALVTMRSAKYSAPVRFINRKVRVSPGATEIMIFDGSTLLATHPRTVARGGHCVYLDHYLEMLRIKPGIFPGSTALAEARESGVFTAANDALWAAVQRTDGNTAATRELIEVLLLHHSMEACDVIDGIGDALLVLAVSADVVAVESSRVAFEWNAGWCAPIAIPA